MVSPSKTRALICIFLTAAVFTVYWQVTGHEFIGYDDGAYVTENQNIQKGFTGETIVWAFTATHASNWHPLTWLSHMLDYQLYGLNPAGHHLTSLLFHTANTLLLFLVLARITGGIWQSAFVAAMFALHPLNVESIAWIAERKNVLSAFFWMLTMWAYIRYTEKEGAGRYLLALLFFALGLMSKPMLVTLPFVLLLLDYWPLRRLRLGKEKVGPDKDEKHPRLILEKIPFMALAAASCFVTFAAQKSGGAIQPAEIYPLQTRIVNALVSYLEYLEKMAWPKGLAVLYPHPGTALPLWKGTAAAVALAGVTVLVLRKLRKAPYLAVGWFWYLGTLVPVIGIVQVGAQAMADRYAYIPLIGIFIAVAWGLPDLLAKRRWRNKVLAVSVAITIPALMAVSWTQAGRWRNSIALFKHSIEAADNEYPNLALLHYNLGNTLNEQSKFDEAVVHYREAVRLKPGYAKAHFNLAHTLNGQSKFDEAADHYRMAVKINPRVAKGHYNLGAALSNAGKPKEAIIHYRHAVRLQPKYAEAHNNLAIALLTEGRSNEAIAHCRKAIELKPDYAEARNNLGVALSADGQYHAAAVSYRQAARLKPDYAEAHYNLGIALLIDEKPDQAVISFREAIKIQPDYPEAYNNLGIALSIQGTVIEAAAQFREAIRLKPDYAEAHYNLGNLFNQQMEIEKAITHYREAVRIRPDYAKALGSLMSALSTAEKGK